MDKRIFVIAEAGCNHNGDPRIAAKLVMEAGSCGADAVKFQIFLTENLLRRDFKKAAHLKNIKKADSVFNALKKLELDRDEFLDLKDIARKEDLLIFASVFDIESLNFANEIGFPIIKIPSGEIVNLELLDEASRCGKPIILSTGMSTLAEVDKAVKVISRNLRLQGASNKKLFDTYPFFRKGLVLMHTTSAYPARPEDLNLKAISSLKDAFNLPVGYSDHSIGDDPVLLALSLGAVAFEKHFTLDRNMDGPDHKASIEPEELKSLVLKIRNAGKMLGDGIKRPSKGERPLVKVFRRAIVAKRDIPKGAAIRREDVAFKRPLDGIPIERFEDIAGMKVNSTIRKDMPVLETHLSRKVAA